MRALHVLLKFLQLIKERAWRIIVLGRPIVIAAAMPHANLALLDDIVVASMQSKDMTFESIEVKQHVVAALPLARKLDVLKSLTWCLGGFRWSLL